MRSAMRAASQLPGSPIMIYGDDAYIGSYNNLFCIKSWKKFANLLHLCKAQNKQDLSPDRIAHLILHILFLENSKSVTLILT